jgi:hypothetical protein
LAVIWPDADTSVIFPTDIGGLLTDPSVITVDVTVAVVWLGWHVVVEFNGGLADWKRFWELALSRTLIIMAGPFPDEI